MIRLTSRLAAAGALALGLTLAISLANALPASAATTRIAAPARATPSGTARIGLAPPPGQRVTASSDIEEESCTSGRATWVHIDTSYGLLCFGYTGVAEWEVPPELYTFCAGNNYGYFEEYNENNGDYYLVQYNHGYGSDFGPLILIVYVEIDGWSGSDTC